MWELKTFIQFTHTFSRTFQDIFKDKNKDYIGTFFTLIISKHYCKEQKNIFMAYFRRYKSLWRLESYVRYLFMTNILHVSYVKKV